MFPVYQLPPSSEQRPLPPSDWKPWEDEDWDDEDMFNN